MHFLYGTYNWNRQRWLSSLKEDREFVWKTITVSTKICSSQFKLCHSSRAGARDPLLLSHWLNYTDKWRWITERYERCYSSVAFSLQCERGTQSMLNITCQVIPWCLMCMCKYLWIWVPDFHSCVHSSCSSALKIIQFFKKCVILSISCSRLQRNTYCLGHLHNYWACTRRNPGNVSWSQGILFHSLVCLILFACSLWLYVVFCTGKRLEKINDI